MLTPLEQQIDTAAEKIDQLIELTRQFRPHQSLNTTRNSLLQTMRRTAAVNSHWPIAWPFWPPGIIAKLIAAAQKITRRLLRWYIDPLIAQQNQFNQATLHTMQMLSYELQALRLELEQNQLNDQAQMQAVLARLDALEANLSTLNSAQSSRE